MAKQGMTFQLTPSQIDAAILEYLRCMFGDSGHDIKAFVGGAPKVTVTVTKKRVRKAKVAAVKAAA